MLKLGGIILSIIFLTSCASAGARKSQIGADICRHTYFGGVKTDALVIIAPMLPIVAMAICHEDDKKEICEATRALKKMPMWNYPLYLLIAPILAIDLPFSAFSDLGDFLDDVDCKLERKKAERSAKINQNEKFREDVKVQEELKKMLDEIQ